MLLSLPNSGSDWLAPMLAEAHGYRYFDKEFFSPICNAKHRETIASCFGCEMVSNYHQIGVPWKQQPQLESLFRQTWEKEDWTADKEVFAFRKVGFFASRFRCVALHRSRELTFPPKRRRVQVWYDAIYWALGRPPGPNLQDRCLRAFDQASSELLAACADESIPVLDYGTLCFGDEATVANELSRCGVHADSLVASILATRRYDHVRFWG